MFTSGLSSSSKWPEYLDEADTLVTDSTCNAICNGFRSRDTRTRVHIENHVS